MNAPSTSPAAAVGRRTKLLLMANSVAIGGMEEHVRLLAQELDRDRFEVHVAMPEWAPTDEFAARLAEIADRFHTSTPDRRHGLRRQLRDLAGIYRIARRERFDVAHVHGTSYHGCTALIVMLRLARVRRVYLTEHLAPETRQLGPARWYRRVVTGRLAGLIAVSENNRDARLKNLGDPGCPVIVVNNGIDIGRFDLADETTTAAVRDELGISADATIVGSAIRLEADKGVDDLVRAFADVHARHSDTVLLLVGTGSQQAALAALADELGIGAATRFAGFRSDPRPYISATDVFVLPVPFGSASIGLLEAMALERPCIITFGGHKEAVVHHRCGYCALPRNPDSLARYIELLVTDPTRRSEFGRAARDRVAADYSATRVARELERVYVS